MVIRVRSSISVAPQSDALAHDKDVHALDVRETLSLQGVFMTLLADGRYDVVVIDAHDISEDSIHLELAVASGAHRGEVVELAARHLNRRSEDVLGLPATLSVSNGVPRVEWE
jgi:hypothetical protein